jgi:hypothetical protein
MYVPLQFMGLQDEQEEVDKVERARRCDRDVVYIKLLRNSISTGKVPAARFFPLLLMADPRGIRSPVKFTANQSEFSLCPSDGKQCKA